MSDLQSSAALQPGDEEQRELWQRFKADKSGPVRERLFSLHAPFAISIARRIYREQTHGDLEFPDLAQHAYSGLLEAMENFDPGFGSNFRDFAAMRIAGSVRDGITASSEMREQIAWHRRVRRERVNSLIESGQSASPKAAMDRLAEMALGLAIGFILEDQGLLTAPDSAGPPVGVLAQRSSAYDTAAWRELVSRLETEMACLPERQQIILREHYGNGVDFSRIAEILALSKGRISQLHRAALDTLRNKLRKQGHFRVEG